MTTLDHPQKATAAGFFGHPPGLSVLFFTELWERFSYYGMRALLILFMAAPESEGGLGFHTAKAAAVYGMYTAMAYMAALPGGWIADRILGPGQAVLAGGVMIAAGHYLLALSSDVVFFIGLGVIVCGTGLLKPNISTMVGRLYGPSDARRDAGFSMFYMGINLGAFSAPLACGYLGQRVDWHLGFGLAAIGMTGGVIQFILGSDVLRRAGSYAKPIDSPTYRLTHERIYKAIAGTTVVGALIWYVSSEGLITVEQVANASGLIILLAIVGIFIWLFRVNTWTGTERKRLIAIAVLFTASTLFWSVFEQAGSTLNLFASRNTNSHLFGFQIPASWFQSVNAFFIFLLAPLFGWLWIRLGEREPSSPAKFAVGLLFAGCGFYVMAGAALITASGSKVGPSWLLVTYLMHSMGELCLSPVGLSAMTKLAPPRVASLMMGVFFLSLSAGNYIGGQLAAQYERHSLSSLFGIVGTFACLAALALCFVMRPLARLMGGVK